MTTSDGQRDFAEWSQDWRAGGERDVATEEQIRSYVVRRSRSIYSFIVADFVIGGVALPVLLYYGVMTDNGVQRFAMLCLASITVATVCFGWWNWRSVLRASASSVSEYIAVSAERIRRMRLAWRVAWMVLAAEAIVFTIWIWDLLYKGPSPAPVGSIRFAWTWLGGFTLAAAAGLVAFGRWLKRDAERFEALRRDLQ